MNRRQLSDVQRSFLSKQFLLWAGLFALGFTVAISGLAAVTDSVALAFVAGVLFSEGSDLVVDRFTDWYLAEQEEESRASTADASADAEADTIDEEVRL